MRRDNETLNTDNNILKMDKENHKATIEKILKEHMQSMINVQNHTKTVLEAMRNPRSSPMIDDVLAIQKVFVEELKRIRKHTEESQQLLTENGKLRKHCSDLEHQIETVKTRNQSDWHDILEREINARTESSLQYTKRFEDEIDRLFSTASGFKDKVVHETLRQCETKQLSIITRMKQKFIDARCTTQEHYKLLARTFTDVVIKLDLAYSSELTKLCLFDDSHSSNHNDNSLRERVELSTRRLGKLYSEEQNRCEHILQTFLGNPPNANPTGSVMSVKEINGDEDFAVFKAKRSEFDRLLLQKLRKRNVELKNLMRANPKLLANSFLSSSSLFSIKKGSLISETLREMKGLIKVCLELQNGLQLLLDNNSYYLMLKTGFITAETLFLFPNSMMKIPYNLLVITQY